MFDIILVALDGSEQSLLALKYAKELAETHDAKMIMIHAYPSTSDLRDVAGYEKLVSQRKSFGQKILDHARNQLGDVSFEVEEDLLEGPAADAVLSVAEVRNADLIVLGTRGMGSLKGVIFGSVSNKVMHYAPCPVMVVR
jgi:nucleotide-binding universal stress UspA family protein